MILTIMVNKKTANVTYTPSKADLEATDKTAGTNEPFTINTAHDGTPTVGSTDTDVLTVT